jgi:hypothetical protein
LRKSLDAIRADTELQAVSHWNLAQQFRSEFEVPTTAFHARQLYHKRTCQDGVEKLFKTRQNGESYVSKTRELNHQEHCFRINVMIAQASQAQGKELKRIIIKIKLERAQLKVERDRMNFLKDILLNYANAVSTVCAAADVVRFLNPCHWYGTTFSTF